MASFLMETIRLPYLTRTALQNLAAFTSATLLGLSILSPFLLILSR